jgi:hypothetical protein
MVQGAIMAEQSVAKNVERRAMLVELRFIGTVYWFDPGWEHPPIVDTRYM